MSAEVLRRAASLMRERANGARNNNPWLVDSDRPNVVLDPDKAGDDWDGLTVCEVPLADGGLVDFPTVEHIASWHPAVALAVADWLERLHSFITDFSEYDEDEDLTAALLDGDVSDWPEVESALTVARAYLGESA